MTARHRAGLTTGEKVKAPYHLVSAWASDQGFVPGQMATKAKSNEIEAIPRFSSEVVRLIEKPEKPAPFVGHEFAFFVINA